MLPKIEYPLYEIYLHSLDRNVKFRPFLVKEEKILLMAKEAKDPASIQLAITQIITNCVQEPLDVSTLPLFDVEMIFIKIRAKSVGESVKLSFNCQNVLPNTLEPCNADTDYTLDLEKVKYEVPEDHDPKIMITDKIGIKLKYPTLTQEINFDSTDETELLLESLLSNIEYIFDEVSVYKPEDTPEAEMNEFIDSLTPETLQRIETFYTTAPKVILEDKVTCKKCGFEHTLHTEGLLDFFT